MHTLRLMRHLMDSTDNYDSSAYDYEVSWTYPTLHMNTSYVSNACSTDWSCVFLTILNISIIVLGICGNCTVMWIAGVKMKRTVNTTWYLSLALSDFAFCAFMPFSAAYIVTSDWVFGTFMCKFMSFIMFLNMFSSIFLLVVISLDRCVVVMFPVWAQNQRTVKKARLTVILAWILSIVLSMFCSAYRQTKEVYTRTMCFNDYGHNSNHKMAILSRFVGGFVIPFLMIVSCYSIIILKLRRSQMAKTLKPFKVMTALIVTFFLCWLPYHLCMILEINHEVLNTDILSTSIKMTITLASTSSVLNPFLYAFMGEDFKQKFWKSFLAKIENAIGEEPLTTSKWVSISNSGYARNSTVV